MVAVMAVILWLLPVWAQATTYYVATTGSNSNNGTDVLTPFLTIDKCARLLTAGDACYVRGGTYTESGGVRILASGTASAPIVLANYPGELPVIDFPAQVSSNRILIEHANATTAPTAIGYITVEGFEIKNGWEGIKFTNLHNSTIRRNKIHDGYASGIFGAGGHHNVFERNVIYHQGNWVGCANGTQACNQQHGMYMHGDSYTVKNNIVYDNIGIGIQHNGSSTSLYTTARHPSVEFSGGKNWIIVDNTCAYQANAAGITIWGDGTNARIENNVLYENRVSGPSSSAQGVFFTGNGGTNVTIRDNHCYASGSGGLACIGGTKDSNGVQVAVEGVNYTQSGNVENVSAPAFVNGGSNALPASPDFRLTAAAPLNMALANEFPNNGVVGAFKPSGAPHASITTNKIRVSFNTSAAVPVQNFSPAGATAACTGTNCPGALTVSAVAGVPNTDTDAIMTISGFPSDACLSTNLAVTISYNAASGLWTGNDDIGPYPVLHQKLFSFTNLAVANNCTGSGPAGYPGGYLIYHKFDEGSGTSANDESANNLDCTLTNGAGWGAGKTGSALSVASGTTQYCASAWGSGVNPSTQDITIFIPVKIEAGAENSLHYIAGPDLGTNQRAYICGQNGVWKISMQSTSCQSTPVSNLAVTSGWNVLTLRFNSTTDVATLYKDDVAGTGGASVAYTSFAFATNWKIGRLHTNNTTGNYLFDDFVVYLSLVDPATLSAAFNAAPSTAAGTLAQVAIQFQGVILDTAGSPIVVGPSVQTIEVPTRGGAVLVFQVNCNTGTDCDQTAFRLVYEKNTSSVIQQVPNIETADGTWMWGANPEAHLNNGPRTTRLTGSCTVEPGVTLQTADQVPSLAIPQTGCTVLAYIVHVDGVAGVDYFDYKLQTADGQDLPGGYAQIARIKVVNPMASGIGF